MPVVLSGARYRSRRRMLLRSMPSRIMRSVEASISTPAAEKFCRSGNWKRGRRRLALGRLERNKHLGGRYRRARSCYFVIAIPTAKFGSPPAKRLRLDTLFFAKVIFAQSAAAESSDYFAPVTLFLSVPVKNRANMTIVARSANIYI